MATREIQFLKILDIINKSKQLFILVVFEKPDNQSITKDLSSKYN